MKLLLSAVHQLICIGNNLAAHLLIEYLIFLLLLQAIRNLLNGQSELFHHQFVANQLIFQTAGTLTLPSFLLTMTHADGDCRWLSVRVARFF